MTNQKKYFRIEIKEIGGLHIFQDTYVHTYIRTCMHACLFVCMYVCMYYVCMYPFMYVYIYIYLLTVTSITKYKIQNVIQKGGGKIGEYCTKDTQKNINQYQLQKIGDNLTQASKV